MPPVIPESLVKRIEDDALVAGSEGARGDTCGPLRLGRSFVHLDLHVPGTPYLLETRTLQALLALLVILGHEAAQSYARIRPGLWYLPLRPLFNLIQQAILQTEVRVLRQHQHFAINARMFSLPHRGKANNLLSRSNY